MATRKNPTALGYLCGIGSMMIGARAAGFTPIGNYEDRKFMLPESFTTNFPGAFFEHTNFLDLGLKPDLLIGHPPCGNFSHLLHSAKKCKDIAGKRKNPGRIPDFIQAVRYFRPKFFVMENLPKSLNAFTEEVYQEAIGDLYRFSLEHVENYHYGNPQKHRKRLFVIGWLKKYDFNFNQIPKPHYFTSVADRIGDLPFYDDIPELDHVHVNPDDMAFNYFGVNPDGTIKRRTYREISELLLGLKSGQAPEYLANDGTIKKKIGFIRLHWNRHSHTITGGGWRRQMNKFHPKTGLPLTIREVLRIQGAPDDFKVCGSFHDKMPQVGKFIAVEFPTFACKQIYAFLKK